MKWNIKRWLAIGLVSALTVSMVGCTKESSNSSSESGTDTSSNDASGNDTSNNEKVELTIWQHEPTEQRVTAWNTVIDKFQKENPNIIVNMEVVLWSDAQAKMMSAIQSSTMPDMNVVSDTSWSSAYLAGGIVEVDDIVETVDNEQDFIDSTLLSYKMDDHYWAVPIDSICYSLLYRPSALEAAGYTEPPKTWSELKEYAEKMTVDTDGDGNIDQYGIGITCSRDALATDTFGAFMASANTDIFDEDGKIVFDNDNTVKALDFYNELYQYAPQAASGWSWGEIESNWAAGTFAMMPYHSPNLAAFFENGDFDIATAPFPKPDDADESFKTSFNHAITVTKGAKDREHYEECKKFIEFLERPEISWILTVCQEPGFYLPTTKAGADLIESGYFDEENFPLKENFDAKEGSKRRSIVDNFLKVAMESSKEAYALGNKYGAVNMNMAEIYNSYIISDMIQKVLLNQENVEEAVKWASDKMETID